MIENTSINNSENTSESMPLPSENKEPLKAETTETSVETALPKIEENGHSLSNGNQVPSQITSQENGQKEFTEEEAVLKIPQKSLKERNERYARARFKEQFGTDDINEIKTRLEKLKEFEKKQEEERLAQLSEVERLKEEIQKRDLKQQKLQEQYTAYQETVNMQEAQRALKSIGSKYLDDNYIDSELMRFHHYLSTVSDEEIQTKQYQLAEEWFQNEVSKRPFLSKDYANQFKEFEEYKKRNTNQGVQKQPIIMNNGIPNQNPNSQSFQVNRKSYSLSAPDSMNEKEWEAEKIQLRKRGWEV